MNHGSFIDYWNAVDAKMQEFFDTDTFRAGIGAGWISQAHEYGWAVEDFVWWCGENYSLSMIS